MNTKQQRIKIAEVCGWRLVKNDPKYHKYWIRPEDGLRVGVAANPTPFPDYPNSLDAMHEAEKTLSEEEWSEYTYQIAGVYGDCCYPYDQDDLNALRHASPSKCAEAFLKAKKLWQQESPANAAISDLPSNK